jgi:hypothetical protein
VVFIGQPLATWQTDDTTLRFVFVGTCSHHEIAKPLRRMSENAINIAEETARAGAGRHMLPLLLQVGITLTCIVAPAVGPTTVFETLLSDHRCPFSVFFNDTILTGDNVENLKKVWYAKLRQCIALHALT